MSLELFIDRDAISPGGLADVVSKLFKVATDIFLQAVFAPPPLILKQIDHPQGLD